MSGEVIIRRNFQNSPRGLDSLRLLLGIFTLVLCEPPFTIISSPAQPMASSYCASRIRIR